MRKDVGSNPTRASHSFLFCFVIEPMYQFIVMPSTQTIQNERGEMLECALTE